VRVVLFNRPIRTPRMNFEIFAGIEARREETFERPPYRA
jgi:hypothetical protein